MSWMEQAKCKGADVETFFPRPHMRHDEFRQIIDVYCKHCPVINQCLDYAMINDEMIGIWGGTSGKQRKIMKRRIKLQRTA